MTATWPRRCVLVLLLVAIGCVPHAPVGAPTVTDPPPVDDPPAPDLPDAAEVDLPLPAATSLRRQAQAVTVRVRSIGCRVLAVGSGFVLPDGVVVTNRHVLDTPQEVSVTTWDGRRYDATVTGVAGDSDLAVLQVADTADLPVARVRTSPVRIGEEVSVVGYPGGGPIRVTRGRVLGLVDGELLDEPTEVLRVDAAITRGNSGGPLFDAQGRVIGVVFAAEVDRDTGLAVPITTLLDRLGTATFVAPDPGPC